MPPAAQVPSDPEAIRAALLRNTRLLDVLYDAGLRREARLAAAETHAAAAI